MDRKEIAADTMRIVEAGQYRARSGRCVQIAPLLARAQAGTTLHRPGDAAPSQLESGTVPSFEVTAETTAVAAQRLAQRESDVMLLNFASARSPGGGFLNGAKAQEEDLALASGLHSCLVTQPRYYEVNRAHESALYTDHVIHSRAVPFFRDADFTLLDQPFVASVLTAPAPNAGVARAGGVAEDAIRAALSRRLDLVLALAAHHGHRTLVLGAWGCGVFQNDVGLVAGLFRDALRSGAHGFSHVCFAIYDRAPGQPTLGAFRHAFPAPGTSNLTGPHAS